MGGILGLVLGFCGAIEYQKNSNPHFHANVYVATVWQQPLKKVAQKIQAKAITLEELFRYQAWLHNEKATSTSNSMKPSFQRWKKVDATLPWDGA